MPPGVGGALEAMPQLEQLRAIAIQLAREPGGGHALGDAADDQEQLGGRPAHPVECRAGEGVEDPATMAAAIVEDRGAVPPVDVEVVAVAATRAGEPFGVEPGEEDGIAGVVVQQVEDGEIHGNLRTVRVKAPLHFNHAPRHYDRPHQLPGMSQSALDQESAIWKRRVTPSDK